MYLYYKLESSDNGHNYDCLLLASHYGTYWINMKKEQVKLRIYHMISLCVSGLGVLLLFMTMWYNHLNPVSGYGGIGVAIMFLLVLLIVSILLIHSFVVSVIYTARIQPKKYWGLIVHLIYIVILLSFVIVDFLKSAQRNVAYNFSYFNQLSVACEKKPIQSVIAKIKNMPEEETPQRMSHIQRCIEIAIQHQRIDVLDALEIQQIPIVTDNNQEYWRSLMDQASITQKVTQKDYDQLAWLMERGKKFHYRLAENVRFLEGYNICYTNLEEPVAQQFADLLIEMGGNINSVTEYSAPAVWYCSRFNRLDQLKFLIPRGARVDVDGGSSYHSPIGEAIENKNIEIVNLLIASGAKTQYNNWEDDLELACTKLNEKENLPASQAVISALKNAGFRFAKDSPYYINPDRHADYDPFKSDEVINCMKQFE